MADDEAENVSFWWIRGGRFSDTELPFLAITNSNQLNRAVAMGPPTNDNGR